MSYTVPKRTIKYQLDEFKPYDYFLGSFTNRAIPTWHFFNPFMKFDFWVKCLLLSATKVALYPKYVSGPVQVII